MADNDKDLYTLNVAKKLPEGTSIDDLKYRQGSGVYYSPYRRVRVPVAVREKLALSGVRMVRDLAEYDAEALRDLGVSEMWSERLMVALSKLDEEYRPQEFPYSIRVWLKISPEDEQIIRDHNITEKQVRLGLASSLLTAPISETIRTVARAEVEAARTRLEAAEARLAQLV